MEFDLLHNKTYHYYFPDRLDLRDLKTKFFGRRNTCSYPFGLYTGNDMDVYRYRGQYESRGVLTKHRLAYRTFDDPIHSLSSFDQKRTALLSEYAYLDLLNGPCLLQRYLPS